MEKFKDIGFVDDDVNVDELSFEEYENMSIDMNWFGDLMDERYMMNKFYRRLDDVGKFIWLRFNIGDIDIKDNKFVWNLNEINKESDKCFILENFMKKKDFKNLDRFIEENYGYEFMEELLNEKENDLRMWVNYNMEDKEGKNIMVGEFSRICEDLERRIGIS